MQHHTMRRSVAAALCLLAAASAHAADTGMYLNLPGAAGESTAPMHVGWIDMYSMQWGAGVNVSPGIGGVGRTIGAPSLSEITWSQNVDTSFPKLLNNMFAPALVKPTARFDLVHPLNAAGGT